MADKICPDCKASLQSGAERCSCGWELERKRGKENKDSVTWDRQCRWTANNDRCRYPVGRFDAGEHTGLCLFHRTHPTGLEGLRIMHDSHDTSDYLERAKAHVYGNAQSPTVTAIRESMGKHGRHAPNPRQPGEDESEH